MRGRTSQVAFAVLLLMVACQKAEPLTAAKANQIIESYRFAAEPIYAEVPQKVWWNPRFPKDEFDDRSLRTFDNLRNAGLITVTGGPTAGRRRVHRPRHAERLPDPRHGPERARSRSSAD